MKETELNEDEEVNGVQKPIWLLTDFTIFDPSHRNEIIPLSSMEDNDGTDRQFEAAGYVAPLLEDEEDAGQEDAIDGEPLPFVRLGALLRFTYDYHRDKECVLVLFFLFHIDPVTCVVQCTLKRSLRGIFFEFLPPTTECVFRGSSTRAALRKL